MANPRAHLTRLCCHGAEPARMRESLARIRTFAARLCGADPADRTAALRLVEAHAEGAAQRLARLVRTEGGAS